MGRKKTGRPPNRFSSTNQPDHGRGRPALPSVIRLRKQLTAKEFIENATILLDMPFEELRRISNDETLPTSIVALAQILGGAATRKDHRPFFALMDRVIGKPAETVQVVDLNKTHPFENLDVKKLDADIESMRDRVRNFKAFSENADFIEGEIVENEQGREVQNSSVNETESTVSQPTKKETDQ